MNQEQLILILGDLNIPQRVDEIPQIFTKLISNNEFLKIISTGNIDQQSFNWIKQLSSDIACVKGNFDNDEFKDDFFFKINNLKTGVIHGHQFMPWENQDIQLQYMYEKDIDILITGYTCQQQLVQIDDKIIINPGSITGSFNYNQNTIPSFVILGINNNQITIYFYKLIENKVQIEKHTINKN